MAGVIGDIKFRDCDIKMSCPKYFEIHLYLRKLFRQWPRSQHIWQAREHKALAVISLHFTDKLWLPVGETPVRLLKRVLLQTSALISRKRRKTGTFFVNYINSCACNLSIQIRFSDIWLLYIVRIFSIASRGWTLVAYPPLHVEEETRCQFRMFNHDISRLSILVVWCLIGQIRFNWMDSVKSAERFCKEASFEMLDFL